MKHLLLFLFPIPIFLSCFFGNSLCFGSSTERLPVYSHREILDPETSRILFLARQGDHEAALTLYQKRYREKKVHDYTFLQQIALALLSSGAIQSDPEIQLLTLFGASIATHEQVYEIIENGLKNKQPLIQLVSLQMLGRLQQERADQAILKALGSDFLILRLQVLKILCEKKHPQALGQLESLLYKLPKALYPLFPPLVAMIGTPEATKQLRRFLQDPSVEVRLPTILSIAKYQRDDLLPQLRQLILHGHYSEMEALAYTLGLFHDQSSIEKLERLTQSHCPTVAIAANYALYEIGEKERLNGIENLASKGNVHAITILGNIENSSWTLIPLLNHPDLQVKVNTILSLFAQKNPISYPYLADILIRDGRDIAYIPNPSPGKTITAVKAIQGATYLLEDDQDLFADDLDLRISILEDLREQSQEIFFKIAEQIFRFQQNDLIPRLTELLEEVGNPEAIKILNSHQKQLGAPLIRHYCTLSLYRMGENSAALDQLKSWIYTQTQTELIRFKPYQMDRLGKELYALTPEESSQLMISILEAFAMKQDDQGISLLLEAIISGHPKNKYALAGILLRATQ